MGRELGTNIKYSYKSPPPPQAYTFHDECHEPDLTHLRYEAT